MYLNTSAAPSQVATHRGTAKFVVGWGEAEFEPGTANSQSGALKLSHLLLFLIIALVSHAEKIGRFGWA